ncbi:predicted protein [Nematostella vectensis]|uniref:G-protein coupled receptors family 1 profile domain-containing protein n=1 Tax=Nematostella vectensis TaxID=45351 RepID=A7T417_NEMVE|nr:predicted protein [Nematostella vectensis]|eukprot:XP_001621393.1 hypothetical protein NEMVEDRAFT_v1g222036 [Nematostella vectensis]
MDSLMLQNNSKFSSNLTMSTLEACEVLFTDTSIVAKTMAYLLILVLSLTGNVFVILNVRCTKNSSTSTTSVLIMNMAVSDLLIVVLAMPRELFEIVARTESWRVPGPPGLVLCKALFFLTDISPLVSVLSLCFIAIERFAVVMYPLTWIVASRRSYHRVAIATSWIVPAIFLCMGVIEKLGADGISMGVIGKLKADGISMGVIGKLKADGISMGVIGKLKADGISMGVIKKLKADGISISVIEKLKADGISMGVIEKQEADGISMGVIEKLKADGISMGVTEKLKADGISMGVIKELKSDGISISVIEKLKADGISMGVIKELKSDGSSMGVIKELKSDGISMGVTEKLKSDVISMGVIKEMKSDGISMGVIKEMTVRYRVEFS